MSKGLMANAIKSQDFQLKRKKDTSRKLRKLSKSPVMFNLNWNYQQKLHDENWPILPNI